ncbi:MAG TPA: hypothetical protein PLV92_05855 [Pirellulaceae bacterium]|nr:hypothetical protein [Pirellulaceae bacterium]
MHSRELAELGALLALQGHAIVHAANPLSDSALAEYWRATKERLNRWTRVLHAVETDPVSRPRWPILKAVVEEIVVSELLARVWTAVSVGHDRVQGAAACEPVVQNVLLAHIDLRRRLLLALIRRHAIPEGYSAPLNHLRRRVERWTDLLLGHLQCVCDASEWGFDRQRVEDFALDLRDEAGLVPGGREGQLLTSALREALREHVSSRAASSEQNQRIAAAVAVSLDPLDLQLPRFAQPLWPLRLHHRAEDCRRMVDQLWELS